MTKVLIGALVTACTVSGVFAAWSAPEAAAVPTLIPEQATVGYGPEQTSFVSAFAYNVANPHVAPVGANDWSCTPSAEHPRPVVLVHGTWVNEYNSFARLSPELARQGYCVFAAVYGDEEDSLIGRLPVIRGSGDPVAGAKEVARFVDAVLEHTGSKQVDMVGYSLGGPVTRQYLRFEGGADRDDPAKNKVKTVVTLGGTNHGTTLDGIGALGAQINAIGLDVLGLTQVVIGPAGIDQVVGSDFVRNLNAEGDTDPGIDYTVIGTRFDEVTTPPQSTFLGTGRGATVRNIWLQDGCTSDFADHLSMMYDPRALHYVSAALDPTAYANRVPPCGFQPPAF
ncbi:esterase/lipase family protein [Nocardia sp. NBC_01327]|uniref:esterase/lipase family protein n=1 Tax=Nocardia sp. NBC_01327 TaxID=2903593 RepID=UPI002E146CCB|nr:alpha/beta fold hydrolase [Nocardia sp. NBC_01327]